MQLYAPAQLDQLQRDLPYFNEITDWVKNFLAKPHPELGRSGPVCPFVPRALQLNTIRLEVIRAKDLEQQQIEEIVKRYRDVFIELEPKQGDLAFYKAIMLVFPDIPAEDAFKLIDGVQQKLKPFFVESGLMLGEFHERNEGEGLHNPNFRPLRSPIPMLAIRFMAESDLPFLDRLTDEPQVRIQYLEAYINRLSTTIKDERKLTNARKALALAHAQLEQGNTVELIQIEPIQVEPNQTEPAQTPSKCPFARLVNLFNRPFRLSF
ncbi:hypothetical protein IQ268_14895 [Oculatella sp. LEGE 06141]|nr:hypothetical protein [Oculatella sp. LEGE 06141]